MVLNKAQSNPKLVRGQQNEALIVSSVVSFMVVSQWFVRENDDNKYLDWLSEFTLVLTLLQGMGEVCIAMVIDYFYRIIK